MTAKIIASCGSWPLALLCMRMRGKMRGRTASPEAYSVVCVP